MQPSYRLLLWTLALTGFGLDQTSKYAAFAPLENAPHFSRAMIPRPPDLVAFRIRNDTGETVLYVNQGAVLGWLDRWGCHANAGCALITLLSIVVIAIVSVRRTAVLDRQLCIALGLILAGMLGNLYDRVLFGGVRDFLYWYLAGGELVFNVADCCLALGVTRLLLHALRPQSHSDAVITVQMLMPDRGNNSVRGQSPVTAPHG